jgi:hypothetical protein
VASAHGETLVARSIFEPLRLTGLPARMETEAFVNEAEWIELDPELQIIVARGRGRMVPKPRPGTSRRSGRRGRCTTTPRAPSPSLTR